MNLVLHLLHTKLLFYQNHFQLLLHIYHLDGPDAIMHVDALMEVEELTALQWTPGAGNPDGGSERWYPMYDRVKAAGKSLWIMLEEGSTDELIDKADKLVKRYGRDGLYLLFLRWRRKTR